MNNKGTIKGLTKYLELDEKSIYDALKLRIINNDISFDIEKKIDELSLFLKKNPKLLIGNYKECLANLTYFKYKFFYLNKNLEKAHYYLNKAYKLGSPDAAAQYGHDYCVGTGITKKRDIELSEKYFKEALSSSSSSNYVEYLKAESLSKTFFCDTTFDLSALEKAVKWYEIALSKNVFESKKGIAHCYYLLEINLDICEKYYKELDMYTPDIEKKINDVKNKKR